MSLNATLIIQVISFLILLMALAKILYKPFIGFLDKRSEKIHRMLEETKENQQLAEEKLKKSEEHLRAAKEEILKLREEGEKQADRHKQRIMQDAEEEASYLIVRTKEDIERQIREVKKEIKKEVGNLAVTIAEKVLDKEIKRADHERLIEDYIKELSKKQ
jgi:F-type H+-transporting ATPase subunit b